MNVSEINGSVPTLGQYFATALPLTALTIWIIVAFQIQIKDAGTSRRRDPSTSRNRRRSSTESSAADTQNQFELRKAYTSANGEIVVNHVHSENEQDTSSSPSARYPNDKTKYDNDGGGYDEDLLYGRSRGYGFQRTTIWKRLAWPISLTQTAFANWQEDRERRGRRKRKAPQMVRGMDEGPDQALPTHFAHSSREPPPSPAARIAAETRSAHSAQSSSKSIVQSTHSSVPPPLPPKTPTPKSTWRAPEVDLVSSVQAVESDDAETIDTNYNRPYAEMSGTEPGPITAEVSLSPNPTV